ncbi:MAG: LysM peptidoglycan-binding domain-containing protein [Chloroflexi bacterium]|nr:LysM peptidoglycan-binding domain-containing protein [Chloroflexota bacterium]
MRRVFIVLLLLALVVSGIALVPPSVTAQDGTDPMQHTVQPGESLFSIAQQYSVTVDALAAANGLTVDSTLFAGQVLVIPGTGNEPAEQDPTMTPAPGETIHVVQAGENLFRIANRYGTTVQAIMNLNGITDPNRIFVGQQLRIPGTQAPPDATESPVPAEEIETATDTPSGDGDEDQPDETETPTETPFVPGDPDEAENEAASVPFDFGVVVQLQNQENQPVVERIEELEVSWAKQRVDWALHEPSRGNYTFENLDVIIDDLDSAGVNIMLTVTSAPTWARASSEESGPPTDYQDYAIFVGRLAQRYQGRVDAYEIWHEPNLRQNWNGKPINGAEYVELLRVA